MIEGLYLITGNELCSLINIVDRWNDIYFTL